MATLGDVLLIAYLAALGGLAALGLHRLSLLRILRTRPAPRPVAAWRGSAVPRVTVQLPVFNERYVVGRLIRAACSLDWPREQLEIQVLDDSSDETSEIASRLVHHYRALGFRIHHLPRPHRQGFKAGALQAGLRCASGEFLAIFDADFLPPRDFLRRAMPTFQDRTVGMVQARWGHLNRDYSVLTRLQGVFLDGHFLVEHAARNRGGLLFNFNGTAGIWRRRCLEDAGGWHADTLTEDLDVSYRAQLKGWRFVYREDVIAPAELPVEVVAFKSQQHRWARGSIQTSRKLAPEILRSDLRPRQKLEAIIHLGNNAAYLLLLLLAVLLVASLPARQTRGWPVMLLETPLFLLGTGSVCAFFLRAQRRAGIGGLQRWMSLPGVMALGIGLAVNNGRAVLEGLWGPAGEFRRTPKHGVHGRTRVGSGYIVSWDSGVVVEAALAVYFLGAILWALDHGTLSALPFLCLFAAGFLFLTLRQLADPLRRRTPSIEVPESHLRS